MRTRAARIRPALWISVLTLLVGATGLLSATGSQAALMHQPELPASPGYWVLTSSGTVYNYGVPNFAGPVTTGRSICPNDVSTPSGDCIGISAPPGGLGYWVGAGPTAPPYGASALAFGAVPSAPGPTTVAATNTHVVGIASAATGCWVVGADGGIFGFAGAPYFGSMGGKPLNKPIVGIASTPDHQGYWLVASDGGIFAFGDAKYYGSMGGKPLNKPIVGMASTPNGEGYWLVASDGGIFAFGDAVFSGSMGGKSLVSPMVGMAANPLGQGYWTVAADGGIFSFGDAPYEGSAAGQVLNGPVVGMAAAG
jgi:hypothetical protein